MHILQDANLEVGAGELVCLLGGNASGKSTTLKTVLGIVRPRTGTRRRSTARTSPAGRRAIASAREWRSFPRTGACSAPMTVLENLQMGAYLHGGGRPGGLRARLHAVPAALRAPQPSSRARSRAASSRWSRWDARSWRGRSCCSWTSRRWGSRRSSSSAASRSSSRCTRPASRCSSSSRTRTCRSRSPTAATCSRPAGSCSRARPSELLQHDELRKAYLGR